MPEIKDDPSDTVKRDILYVLIGSLYLPARNLE